MKKGIKVSIFFVYTALCCMLLFGATGNAYIDPSVMTYVIQAVAGVVIAVGAVVGIYFRRAKKKLKIDENRNKEIESDEIEAAPEATATVTTETAPEENND